MLSTIAQIAFFGIWGINYFYPFKWAGIVMAIAALVIAIVLLVGVAKK